MLAFWDPAHDPGPVLCLFRRATGIACPACGLTRAASLAAHGRFAEALALHPALPLLAFEAALGWLVWGLRLLTGRRLLSGWLTPVLLGTVGGLIVLWIVRLLSGTLPS